MDKRPFSDKREGREITKYIRLRSSYDEKGIRETSKSA